jgi:hypothetical protein
VKRRYSNREFRKHDLKRLSRYASSLLGLTRRTVLFQIRHSLCQIGYSDSLNTVFRPRQFLRATLRHTATSYFSG